MKRFLALAALVLGLASCQTEPEGLNVNVGGEVDTTITVTIPETETRYGTESNSALSIFDNGVLGSADDNKTMRYILEIYYKNELFAERQVDYSDGKTVSFPVRLVAGRKYNFVVWADYVESKDDTDRHYNTKSLTSEDNIKYGLTNVTLNNTWNAMDETRDAFTGFLVVDSYNGTQGINIPLTRPFAKLRVITTDVADLAKLGLEAESAKVVYTTPYRAGFNAATGTAIAANGNDKKAHDTFAIATYGDSKDGKQVLFTDYFFATDEVVKFELAVYDQNNNYFGSEEYIKFNTDIPVKRNYLTTIQGNVLTDGNNVTVTVENDGAFAGKIEELVASDAKNLQEIINTATDGKQTAVTLVGDIDLSALINAGTLSTRAGENAGLVIPANKVVVLNLNGFNISQTKACTATYSMIVNNGNLTISGNGTVEFTNTAEGGGSTWGTNVIENRTGAELVIDDATIRHNGCLNGDTNHDTNLAIQNYQGKVTVNSGTITSTQFRSLRDFTAGGEIIINGGTFNGQVWMQGLGNGSSSLTINGGNFSPVQDYDGSSVYITNNTNVVNVAINGGFFNTKIGCYDANKEGVKGCITAGTFTASAKENTNESLIDSDYTWSEAENSTWTLERKADVAKIGEVGYTSLQKAVAAVQDGETITLVANETFTEKNSYDNDGWKDGLGYAGDKSFTIDLNGKTVSQNGALNDYLIWVKNVGSKANTITIKNGTLDAGTTAFCALCTASSHDNQLTINLENVNLINNKSNGSTVKVRAGSVVNVNAGTKITGKDSYLGIENWKATVNIYDGAEIYMNGTSSYNGCLVGVGGNGTVNVYGGYGKGVKGGFIAMTSGGTINVAGGEWIANTNGSIGNNSNLYVLTAQSNKYESGFAGPSIINVTGGTLRGGMDAWVLNNLEGEKAELNISGGNFNANPTNFLAEGCEVTEANGVWNVRVLPVAQIGETEYETLEAAVAAAKAGDTITLLRDVKPTNLPVLKDITLCGNGQHIDATIDGDNLTIAGHVKVTLFNGSNYNRNLTILEGGCLEVTSTARISLGFGNTWNVTGSIKNAKTADKANIQPSLIIPGGISITGGSNATMNVTNAYVSFGNTSSKNSSANGEFSLNFTNSIVDFTNQFTFAEPTSGKNPTFNVNITDSVVTCTAKMCFAAPGCEAVINNSIMNLKNNFRNSGKFDLVNGSVMNGSTIQFGENGGNNGAITVDASNLTINAVNTGSAFDGKDTGSITAKNGAEVSVTYYKAMTIAVDETSTFTGTEVQ